MWNLKCDTNELIYEIVIESDKENRFVVAKRQRGAGRAGPEV